MASTDILPSGTPSLFGPSSETLAGLNERVESLSLQNDTPADQPSDDVAAQSRSRPPLVYTRSQALLLYKSPLVQAPDGMPQLKDWFGDWNEQNSTSKKDSETTTTASGARDRRFRREAEDGADPSSKPTFRSALSQPSQMGNFKHQPLRGSERERDLNKERERDLRDKDGQDRLRSLSDKYDRDRLSLSSASALRGKERELAPHLNSASGSSRLAAQGQLSTTARRTEPREPARKRAGDNAEDWRRGAESGRGRDDRSENSRNDREEEPRTRLRNGSKTRRDPSTTRRERDRDDKDKDKDRDGDRNRDRRRADRDEPRRERDDPAPRRIRDGERDGEDEERHWRDDGKRDERLAARRDRDRWDRNDRWDRSEKPARDDVADRARDKDRWNPEERETRPKRGGGRDRKGAAGDDTRDRDDRHDREREKDKEPAWMETYVPDSPSAGILGGKGLEGELDDLQAWKKGMKEREQRAAGIASGRGKGSGAPSEANSVPDAAPSASGGSSLDEIQQFKLIMKKAQEDKQPAGESEPSPTVPLLGDRDLLKDFAKVSKAVPSAKTSRPNPEATSIPLSATSSIGSSVLPMASTPQTNKAPVAAPEVSNPLLALLTSTPGDLNVSSRADNGLSLPSARIPSAAPANFASPDPSTTGQQPENVRSAQLQANPLAGSRFFGNRSSAAPSVSAARQTELSAPPQQTHEPSIFHSQNSLGQYPGEPASAQQFQDAPPRRSIADAIYMREQQALEAMRLQQQSRGYESPSNQGFIDRGNDMSAYAQMADYRRSMTESPVSAYTDGSQGMGQSAGLGGMDQSGGFGGRGGSRFAKLWDNDGRGGRGGHVPQGRTPPSVDLGSYPAPLVARQDSGGLNGLNNGGLDNRVTDQLFAILNNQSQGQRGTPVNQLNHAHSPNPASFTVNYPNNQLGQQQHPMNQQHFSNGSRQEILHESRMDDRFVPDNMVPGLRTTPLGRGRENGGTYYGGDQLDDALQYSNQRLPLQARGLDPMLSGPIQSLHPQAGAHLRTAGLPLQQGQFRGGPSPISATHGINPLHGQQRGVPVGLANLGSRPPHDPGQFIGAPMGMGGGNLSGHSPSQAGFNNLSPGGMGGFGGGPPMRGPPGAHQLPNALGQGGLNGMSMQGGVDPRSTQAQLLGLGVHGGMRGSGGGYGVPQGLAAPVPGAHMGSRQLQPQPQHHYQSQMGPGLIPSHLQQTPGPSSQDLMALLMGGRRE